MKKTYLSMMLHVGTPRKKSLESVYTFLVAASSTADSDERLASQFTVYSRECPAVR